MIEGFPNAFERLERERDECQMLYMRALAERDESRREHLITQEMLASVTRQRDALERIRCNEFLTATYKLVTERITAAFVELQVKNS